MVGVHFINHCNLTPSRKLRQVMAVILAYGLATHHILVAFAVTAMALSMQGQGDSTFTGSASTRQLIMVLCRPSTLWTDADNNDIPDGSHLKTCCALSAIQAAGILGSPKDFISCPLYDRSTDILWYSGQILWPESYRFSPPARAPPVV